MTVAMETHQHTLKRQVSCRGVGLHSGRLVNLTIKPAPVNSGIRFFRSDLADCEPIPAHVDRVVDTRLATTIGINGSVRISTTEHLLAALRGSSIDNVDIEIDAAEVPIMDGSAGPFVMLLKKGGRVRQAARRKVIRVTEPIEFTDGDRSVRIEPYDGFKVTGRISFDDNLISEQCYSVDLTPERFRKDIAKARTFGFVEQVEHLWANGLALGGTLENVIAIHWNRNDVLNEEGLRFDDEFIRHKVLDLVGDLVLLGHPLLGHVIADKAGHATHVGLMRTLVDSPGKWEFVELKRGGGPRRLHLQGVLNSTMAAGERLKPLLANSMPTTALAQAS